MRGRFWHQICPVWGLTSDRWVNNYIIYIINIIYIIYNFIIYIVTSSYGHNCVSSGHNFLVTISCLFLEMNWWFSSRDGDQAAPCGQLLVR